MPRRTVPDRGGRSTFAVFTLPLLLWATAMLTVSSLPADKLPGPPSLLRWDKLAHSAEFMILAFLLVRFFRFARSRSNRRALVLSATLGIAYAAFDEIHQHFIPLRQCTWQDFVADSAGVLAGLVTATLWYAGHCNNGKADGY